MKNLFERTSSTWVRYSEYEWKKSEDGILYLTPSKTAQPSIYDPLTEYQQIVLDAINIGRMGMSKKPDEEIQKTIQQFAVKYGLFGLMTALPTTPNFMDYKAVYLPKNHFIKEETMATEDYLKLFFPFDKLDVVKKGVESSWMIGSVSPAMHKYIWKPAWWVFTHKVKSVFGGKYSMYENKICREYRDGKVCKDELDKCSTCDKNCIVNNIYTSRLCRSRNRSSLYI